MTDCPELKASFNGRSYEEMVETLEKTVFYPIQLCPACGRSYVDFDELKACPFCGLVV
ncbi:MAG: hypothetical protein ACT6FG_00510 [Methanosarcinaceae archaeon]